MPFDGRIREFSLLGIDKFNTSCSTFLLTHCHADHLVGLLAKSFSGYVYCSEDTKRLLQLSGKYDRVMPLLQAKRFHEPFEVLLLPPGSSLDSECEPVNVTITLLPAYHCLGATMFLVESDSANVLCTGDIKAEGWWRESLQTMPALSPYINGSKKLDNMYVDMSFSYRREPYIEIPPNNAGIHTAIQLLKDYPEDPEIVFLFHDTTLGFEQAWAFILSYFRGALHVCDAALRRKIDYCAKRDPTNGPSLFAAMKRHKSGNYKKGVFHTCSKGCADLDTQSMPPYTVKIKQCVNFNILDLTGTCFPLRLDTLRVDEKANLKMIRETQLGNRIYELRDRQWVLPKNGTEFLPADVKLIFARHSSYSETARLVEMFSPRQVYPTEDQGSWMNGFVMSRLFGKFCDGNSFIFDEEMAKVYGNYPPDEILDTPVATIDRWDTEECKEEERLIEEVKLTEKVALLNLRKVVSASTFQKKRTPEEQDFVDRRNKDFKLQKITEGRREISYRKFIEEQQEKYYKKYNLPGYKRDYESAKYMRTFNSTLGGSSDYDTDSCSSLSDIFHLKKQISVKDKSSVEDNESTSLGTDGVPETEEKKEKLTSSRQALRRSFIASSFNTYEESLRPNRHSLSSQSCSQSSILFLSEKEPDHERIEYLSKRLLADPSSWRNVNLQSTKL